MLEKLTVTDFEPHVGTVFPIQLQEGDPLQTKLISVKKLGEAPKPEARQAFSLLFQGPREPLLHQQIYPVEHPTAGKLDIFLVPVGEEKDGLLYEAIFT